MVSLAAASPTPAATASRGPYVQLVSHDSILVVWRTDAPDGGRVEYGLDLTYGAEVAAAAPATQHALTLTGLSPRATYFYRVWSGTDLVAEGKRFTTAPAPGSQDPFAFVVFGDSGAGTPGQLDVAARIAVSQRGFGLHIGDLIYSDDVARDLDRYYFDVYKDTLAETAVYVALGNKDVEQDGGAAILDAFHLPDNGLESDALRGRCYAFVHGNALIAAVDSNLDLTAGSEQVAWLDGALAAGDPTWKIVFLHLPVYGSGRSEAPHRAALEPLFLEHGVDLVFQGHTHFYERTFPIRDGVAVGAAQEPDFVDAGGPVYVVTGGGGGTLITAAPRAFSARYESTYHHVAVEIQGPKLRFQAIQGDGTVIDAMTLAKSVAARELFRRGDADINGGLELTDAVRILGYLFLGTTAPECLEAADADDSGGIELTDAVRILTFLFLGSEPPAAPGPPPGPCGPDPAGSPALGCGLYPACG